MELDADHVFPDFGDVICESIVENQLLEPVVEVTIQAGSRTLHGGRVGIRHGDSVCVGRNRKYI